MNEARTGKNRQSDSLFLCICLSVYPLSLSVCYFRISNSLAFCLTTALLVRYPENEERQRRRWRKMGAGGKREAYDKWKSRREETRKEKKKRNNLPIHNGLEAISVPSLATQGLPEVPEDTAAGFLLMSLDTSLKHLTFPLFAYLCAIGGKNRASSGRSS